MAGIMGLFASELDEFVADYDNQFWDASFHGETYPPRIIMERSTPPLYAGVDCAGRAGIFQAAQPQTQIGSSAEGSGRFYPLNAWPESPATL